ncbi:MAG: 30S ribosomal protein S16 [Chlamydiia bacterium]|nr:30S ribosomal protein S16 [Chlamydiia bacterium]
MALAIRLRQQGRHDNQTFRLVLTDEKSRRDGKYHELLGWYNPHEDSDEKKLSINAERIEFWLNQGAKITESAKNLVSKNAPEVMKRQRQKAVEARAKARLKSKARAKAKSA